MYHLLPIVKSLDAMGTGVDSPVLWSAPEEGVLMGSGMQTKEGDAGGYTLKQGVLRSGREHRLLSGDLATPCPVSSSFFPGLSAC